MTQLLSADFQTGESALKKKKLFREWVHWCRNNFLQRHINKKEAHPIKHFAEDAITEKLDNCRYLSATPDKSLSNKIVSVIQI